MPSGVRRHIYKYIYQESQICTISYCARSARKIGVQYISSARVGHACVAVAAPYIKYNLFLYIHVYNYIHVLACVTSSNLRTRRAVADNIR